MQRKDDLTIEFDEPSHVYTCEGETFSSVTQTIESYFQKFVPDVVISGMMKSRNWPKSPYYGMTQEQIKQTWKERADTGTRMHAQIEDHILNCCDEQNKVDLEMLKEVKAEGEFERELSYFREFVCSAEIYEYCYPEFRTFSLERKIAGTIDLLTVDEEGNCRIYDWKRVEKLKMENPFQKGKLSCSDLDDCNFNHYSLQLNLYRKLIKENYTFKGRPLKVKSMTLVLLHPENDSYVLQEIRKMDRI